MENAIYNLAIYALPIFLTLTMPVALQAWVANRLGDRTPFSMGRLSWDPVKHTDWIGTVALPAAFMLLGGAVGLGGLLIGWAKPLYINPRYLPARTQGQYLWSLFWVESPLFLGPLAMAFFWALVAKLVMLAGINEPFIAKVCAAGVSVGLSFFAISLLPLPPFPLGNTLLRVLPNRYLDRIAPVMPYMPMILLGLLILGALHPWIRFWYSLGAALISLLLSF